MREELAARWVRAAVKCGGQGAPVSRVREELAARWVRAAVKCGGQGAPVSRVREKAAARRGGVGRGGAAVEDAVKAPISRSRERVGSEANNGPISGARRIGSCPVQP